MDTFTRILIYKDFSADADFYEIMEVFVEGGLNYDFNNGYFFNEEEMSKEDLLSCFSFCLDNNLNFKILNDDSFKVDNTNAIGTFCLNTLACTGSIDIQDNSIFIESYKEESCLYFILNLDKISEKVYEVNVIDVKKKLFFKDRLNLEYNEDLIEQTILFYKENKEEIKNQGFDKSAAFTVIEHCIYINNDFVLP